VDQLYFEQGYLEEGYYTIIREANVALSAIATATAAVSIADTTGYYIPDYIEIDYFVGGGALIDATGSWSSEFQVTATIGKLVLINSELVSESTQTALVGRILEAAAEFTSAFSPTLTADAFKNSTAILDSVSTVSVDAVANRSANVLLEHIADLNAMAAKTVDAVSPMAASTTVSASATLQTQTSASLSSTASLSCSAFNVQFASAAFTARSTMLPAADRARIFFRYNPLNLSTNIPSIDKTEYKFGTGALKLLPSSTATVVSTTTLPVGYFDFPAHTADTNQFTATNFAVSFWLKQSSNSLRTTPAIRIQDDNFTAGGSYLQINYDGNLTIRSGGVTGSTVISNYNQTLTRTNWNYYEIISYWDGTVGANRRQLAILVNGSPVSLSGVAPAITSYTGSFVVANNPTVRLLADSSQTMWIDDARIVIAQTNWGHSGLPASRPARPAPTAEQGVDISNSATKVLLNFNNNFHDLVGTALLQTATATITAASTVTAEANANTKIGAAAVNSTVTLAAAVSKLVEANADISSTATVAIEVVRIRDSDAAANSESTVTAVIGAVKPLAIELNDAFTPTVTVTAQLAGVALLESQFAQTTQAVKTADVISTQVSTAELTATSTVTVGVSADFSAAATTDIDAERLRFGSSDLSTVSDFSIDFLKLRPAGADLSSASTVTADAARFRTTQIATDVQSTVTANVDRFRLTAGDFGVDAEVTVTATRIQQGNVALSAEFQQSTNAVKDTDVVANAVAEVTQTTTAVKTVDALPLLESIATQLTAAFKNASGTITLESQATVTAFAGTIKEYAPKINRGVRADNTTPRITLSGLGTFGLSIRTPGFTASIWVKRETVGNVFQTIWMPWVSDNIASFPTYKTGLVFDNNNVRLRNVFDSDEPGATWSDVAPMDTEWHNIVLRCETSTRWHLWVDGVYRGSATHNAIMQSHTFINSNTSGDPKNYAQFGTGIGVDPFPGLDESSTTNNDISVAQFWAGVINQPIYKFPIGEFYDGGYRDLGTNGRGDFNILPQPLIYSLLNHGESQFYVTPGTTASGPASSAITVRGPQASTSLTAQPQAVLVDSASLAANTAVTVLTNYNINQPLAFSAEASIELEPTTRIGIVAVLATQAVLTAQAVFEITEAFAALSTAVELQADFDVKPPVRAEAALTAEFSLVSDPNSFSDNTALIMTVGDLVCDATLIPPIRIDADLVSEFTVTATIGAIEQFAVLTASSGTLDCSPTAEFSGFGSLSTVTEQTTTANKFLGISNLVLQSNGFQVTVGDAINIDPFLQLKIAQETRRIKILPESRTLNIEQETRTLLIKGHP
jgi:hypothetical protein